MNIKLLFRPGSLWIGAHWSPQNRQWCVNLIPCVTLRIRLKRATPTSEYTGATVGETWKDDNGKLYEVVDIRWDSHGELVFYGNGEGIIFSMRAEMFSEQFTKVLS